MSEFELLKEKHNVKTSEDLLSLPLQPSYQCPKVDIEKKEWNIRKRDIKSLCEDLKDIEVATKNANDIIWEVDMCNIDEAFEELRQKCADIRDWGQSWKDLAKDLICKVEGCAEYLGI